MKPSPEPRFARVATMIGDPTRARMLSHLLAGQLATAGELATAVGVTPQTASAHLAKLLDAGILAVRVQGRHRYYKLADGDIAHALEALAIVAERGTTSGHRDLWSREGYRTLRHARTCYGHLAGRMGVALHDALLAHEVVRETDGRFTVTDHGHRWLRELGVDAHAVRPSRERGVAYPCVDWSERRDHFAGPLAVTLLEQVIAKHWMTRVPDSRALSVTPRGREALVPLFGRELLA